MARTLLDYMPVSKKNISKFLSNNFQNLSSYRIFELVKRIPNEEEKLNSFVKYYDQISHGSFERSYLDLFNIDNKYILLEKLQDKIFDKKIYIILNDIIDYFENKYEKLKVIESIKNKLNIIDDIDRKLIFKEIKDIDIKLKILDVLNILPMDKYAYYVNYISDESVEIKLNNINKFGEINFYNVDIISFVNKIESDELKYYIIEKYFKTRNDISDIELTRLSMELIKFIKDNDYKNKIVDLVKLRVNIENNNQ